MLSYYDFVSNAFVFIPLLPQNVSKPTKLDGKNFESNLAVGNENKTENIVSTIADFKCFITNTAEIINSNDTKAEDPNQNPKKENTIVSVRKHCFHL